MHLPVQSGSDRILNRMNRKYTKEHYLNLVNKLKESIPNISLTTDIIVGFPGETEEEFEELREFVEKIKFERLGVFAYSREEDTPAYNLDGQLEDEEKQKRQEILMMIQAEISQEWNENRIGSTVSVLVEDRDEIIKSYYGRTYADSIEIDGKVFFKSDRKLSAGEFVQVEVEQALEYDIFGKEK